mgnify:CR=1 FL=1
MDYANILTEIAPILATAGGLLWSFSKKVHQIEDMKNHIEGNRQGRIEVFGVINNLLKVKDNELSERLARVETIIEKGIDKDTIQRLATIEAELGQLSK